MQHGGRSCYLPGPMARARALLMAGLECRADNFILKPYDAEQLLRRIQLYWSIRRCVAANSRASVWKSVSAARGA